MDQLIIEKELRFRTSRSSGSGGQNVNKVETRVELIFEPALSNGLTSEEKALLLERLPNKITKEGHLIVVAQESRSQAANRTLAIKRFFALLEKSLEPEPEREEIPERLVAHPVKRKKTKKITSEKKSNRRKVTPPLHEED
jgi:ribosome-associated protein